MERKCCGKELVFTKGGHSVHQAKCDNCGSYYQHLGGEGLYKTIDNGQNWFCVKCKGEIEGVTVHYPVHDGPFPLSGSGQVITEMVPYCPKCEKEPNSSGDFINPKKECVGEI
jgi:hypothetical protein